MFFRLIDTGWKIAVIVSAVVLAHAFWFHYGHDREVIQRCGAALIILGVLVAARGFLREGVDAAVNRQLPQFPFGAFYSEEVGRQWKEHIDKIRPEIEKDIRAERQWASTMIVLGTAINGYGDLSAPLLKRFI